MANGEKNKQTLTGPSRREGGSRVGRLLKNDNGGAGWKLAVSPGRLAGLEIKSGAAPVDGAPEE